MAGMVAGACLGVVLLGGGAAQAASDTYFSGGSSNNATHSSTKRVASGGSLLGLTKGSFTIQARSSVGASVNYQSSGSGNQFLSFPAYSSVSTCFWQSTKITDPPEGQMSCRQDY